MLVATPDRIRTSPAALPPFDGALLRKQTFKTRALTRLLRQPQWLYAILRRFAPILRIPRANFVIVTRDEDVREVLSRDADFPVPFGENFKTLDPAHQNFILGMPNSPTYRAIRAETMKVFSLADIPRIARMARERSEVLLEEHGGEIDVMRDLLTRVLVDITRDYYGVDLPYPDGALWLMAMSYFDFIPVSVPTIRALGQVGSDHLAPVITGAMDRAKEGEPGDTIVSRYIQAQRNGNAILTDDVIRATLTGMIAGFVPTNTLATGHLIEMLLDNPAMMGAAERAARDGDDDLLDRCLFEAFRWRPINPGPFRRCDTDTVIASGTPRQKTVRTGDLVLAATGSAMFDPRRVRNPNRFDPNRPASDYLHFGHGQHWCLGFAIARAQMTQTFKPLLARGAVRRAPGPRGVMTSFGTFPEHLTVTYGRRRSAP
jgi:cytochrome P450